MHLCDVLDDVVFMKLAVLMVVALEMVVRQWSGLGGDGSNDDGC
jgi:hypothetical protein